MSAPLNKFLTAFAVIAALFVAGCTSTGTSVSGYAGPSISSVTAKRATALKDVGAAKKQVRLTRKNLAARKKKIARAERQLKRKKVSKKRKAAYAKTVKTAKSDIRKAERAVSRAESKLNRTIAAEKRATKAIATAKRRKAEADRRVAAAKARKAAADKKKRELAAARKEAEEKKRQIADARKSLERKNPRPSTSSLFALADPALKNINDYKARVDGGFPVAAIPVNKLDKRLLRQEVRYRTSHKVGTIVVDTGARYLYLVKSGGKALRYGIGVGRAGFAWSGSAHIGWKQQWPKWTPPKEMIARQPSLAKYCADCGGMPGGPANPLGARALYLMKDGKDTLFRLHGTPKWASIGTAASSGCIRLINQDVIDLYKRVPQGTKVVVL